MTGTNERPRCQTGTGDRLEGAATTLAEIFGESDRPIELVSAPGRVNLIGGHTDYNEGFVLPMAIDHRHVVAARSRDDGPVSVHSIDFDETHSYSPDRIEPPTEAHWVDYVKGITDRLQARGHDVGGAELVVDGGVPMGAGLASSAALEVAVAGALDAVHDLAVGDDLVRICWEAETEFVGVNCGMMDQYAAVHGESTGVLFLDCRTMDHEVVPMPDGVEIVATDTNVHHELVDSAYNDRVATCESGVAYFDRVLDGPVTSLRDVPIDAFEGHQAALPETVRKRVRHVLTENERVREAASALRVSDLEGVGDLLSASHLSLREDYQVSVDELDAVVSIANDLEGVYGSRMTGAGFGGCVVSLVRSDVAATVSETIRETYAHHTGIAPDVYRCGPDDGLRRHDPVG